MNEQEFVTTFEASTCGLRDMIEAISFQDAAQKMLEKHNLTSVASIMIDDQTEGAIEFLDCQIVSSKKLTYRSYAVHNLYDESDETIERLDFYASLSDSPQF